jgi:7-carboxy-7-deazaguanine synthase
LDLSAEDIISRLESYGCNFIEFTGGEPLYQKKNLLPLMSFLCDKGYTVAIETSGNVDTSDLDTRIIKILDMKCPSSNMTKMNNYHNLEVLTGLDEVKFVIGSREDYEWARQKLYEYKIHERAFAVLFSPVFGMIEPVSLAEWVLEDRLPVRMQLQMHKFIWAPETRGV